MMTPPKKILKESMSYSPEKQSGANTLIVSLPFLIFQCSSLLLILGACIKALLPSLLQQEISTGVYTRPIRT
jgi:hypothetical protein